MEILKHSFFTSEYLYNAYMLKNEQGKIEALSSVFIEKSALETGRYGTTFSRSYSKGRGQDLVTNIIKDLPGGLLPSDPRYLSEKAKQMYQRLNEHNELLLSPHNKAGRQEHGVEFLDSIITIEGKTAFPVVKMTQNDFVQYCDLANKSAQEHGYDGLGRWFLDEHLTCGNALFRKKEVVPCSVELC